MVLAESLLYCLSKREAQMQKVWIIIQVMIARVVYMIEMSYRLLFWSNSGLVLLSFSCWVMSNSLWPHGPQHARLPCPSLSPRVCSNSCPLSWWGHPIISSSVTSFSFYPQSFPAARSFPMSQLFALNSSRYWSFSFSISPSNVYSRLMSFKVDWFDLLAVQGTLKSLL